MTLDLRSLGPTELSPSTFRAMQGTHHFVEFFETSTGLVEDVTRFVAPGLMRDEAAVIIADEPRRTAIQHSLRSAGVSIEQVRDEGRYVSLSVDEMLPRFMTDGVPNRGLFFEQIGAVIDKAGRRASEVRVYGEMVAKLWDLGHPAAAIRVEELWNQLSATHSFRLFCAYPASCFGQEDRLALQAICQQHSHVFPPRR